MGNLRTLTLTQCKNPRAFIHALHPGSYSSDVVICPKLEEIVFVLRADGEEFGTKAVIAMAIARVSRRGKLRTIRIADRRWRLDPKDVVELRKHALHVEYGPSAGADYGESDDGDGDSDGNDEDDNGSYDGGWGGDSGDRSPVTEFEFALDITFTSASIFGIRSSETRVL